MLEHHEGRPLYSAMKKYGIEHFSIQELGEYPLEELAEQEQLWIEKLDTYNTGYNATRGGEGTQQYDYDLFVKEYNNGMLINEIANKYNCDCQTVSKALHKNNIDTSLNSSKIDRYNSIPVEQYTLDNTYLRTFKSGCNAAQWIIDNRYTTTTNIRQIRNNIAGAARQQGYRKTAYGFKWKLLE